MRRASHLPALPAAGARRPFPFLLTAVASALLSPALQAADTPATDELATVTVAADQDSSASYTVPTTKAATKLSLTPRETPQSVTVVTRQRLDDQNLVSLRDVLDNVTGIYSFGYDTERTVFTARGFVLSNTLIDGVPTLTRTNTDSADASLDTALYERIEVVRGATGLLTGAGNPSAAINLVRKRADSREASVTLEASAGSWNDYRTSIDASSALTDSGTIRGRVVAAYEASESYMDFYSSAKDVFYGTLEMDLTPGTTLAVGYDYQKTTPDAITWGWFPLYLSDGSPANWPRSVTTAPKWSFWDNTSQTAFAELRQELGADWSLRTTFSHRETDGDMALFYVSGFPDPGTGLGLSPSVYRSTEENQQNAVDAYASGPFQFLGRQHELVLGASASWTDLRGELFPEDAATVAPVGNFFAWDGNYPMPVFSSEATNIKDIATDETGFYAATRLSVADPLTLVLGARYSQWKTDYYDFYSGTFRYDKRDTTPYAGVIVDISPEFSVFASYTTIFTPQNNQAPNGGYLDPITGVSQEVGIKGEHLDGRLNTALTLFDTRQDNVAEALPGQFLPDGVTQAYHDVDGARSRGFELEINGEITPGWNTALGWSYSKLEDANGEVLKSYIPRTLVRLFSSAKMPGSWDKLTLGGGANWQAHSSLETSCPAGTCDFRQDAVLLLSLMARYQFTPALSAQLNADNLLDKSYYVVGEYDSVNYAPPRNATLGVKYRF